MVRSTTFVVVLFWALGSGCLPAVAQAATATVRVEVLSDVGPVKDADVTVGAVRGRTDGSGVALLQTAPGEHDLRVIKSGFVLATAVVRAEEGTTRQIVVELVPLPQHEEQVTVSATRTDQRLEDVPIRVEVLNREEIEEKMLMTPGDIVMMLNEMGGLRVQATSPSLGAASVRIQGMRGRYTRFLSDGLPLYGQQMGGFGLLQIPPMDLGQVEVIKGVASALYGSGAMGGVVNLISRRPKEALYELLLNGSTDKAADAMMFLARPLSRQWSATLLGGLDYQARKDMDGDGWADLAGYSRGTLRPRLFWDGGEGRSAFLTGGVTLEDREGGTLPGAVLRVTGAPYPEMLDTKHFDVGGSFQVLIRKKYVLTGRGSANWQRQGHLFGPVRERDRRRTLFGELAVRGTAGKHTWVGGFAVEQDRFRPLDLPAFAYRYTTPGVFVQDEIAVASWLAFSVSGRLDFHSRYGAFFSPRVSALVRKNGWTSRLSAGEGFFAPTPLTEETEAAGLSRLTIPVPLLAERGRSASWDLTRTAGPGSYTVTLFGSRVRHPLHVSRVERYELINSSEAATNAGVELLATIRPKSFVFTGTYAYVRSREDEGGRRVDVPLTPRHSTGVVGMWEKEDAGRIGAEFYYTGRQRLEDNPYRGMSKPYIQLGLLLEKRFGPIRLFLNCENLTDVRQTRWDPLLRPLQAADGRWTVDAWSPLYGRVFNGGIRFQIRSH